CQQYESNPLTF
nr:immunoglobulin light chain junction region [Macaca mulatta]